MSLFSEWLYICPVDFSGHCGSPHAREILAERELEGATLHLLVAEEAFRMSCHLLTRGNIYLPTLDSSTLFTSQVSSRMLLAIALLVDRSLLL